MKIKLISTTLVIIFVIIVTISCFDKSNEQHVANDINIEQEYIEPVVEAETITEIEYKGYLEEISSSDYYDLNITELELAGFPPEVRLIGVTKDDYWFESVDESSRLTYHLLSKTENESKTFSLEMDVNIYRSFIFDNKIYIIIKDTDTSFEENSVSLIVLNEKLNNFEIVYSDNGTKFPMFTFTNNDIVLFNVYTKMDNAQESRVTLINPTTKSTRVIESVTSNVSNQIRDGNDVLRIGGVEDTLYIEYASYNSISRTPNYFIKKINLNTNKSIKLSIPNPVDFLSGYSKFFISRLYGETKSIKSGALSLYIQNANGKKYEQYVLKNSDSFRNPYLLGEINSFYILLQTFEIKIIDTSNLTYSSIIYRDSKANENLEYISPPFIHESSIYLMRNYNDIYQSKLIIEEYKFK